MIVYKRWLLYRVNIFVRDTAMMIMDGWMVVWKIEEVYYVSGGGIFFLHNQKCTIFKALNLSMVNTSYFYRCPMVCVSLVANSERSQITSHPAGYHMTPTRPAP